MKKVLIAYYPTDENPKVAQRIEKLFSEKKISVIMKTIEPKVELDPKEQARYEKDLELKNYVKSLNEFDLIVIGTPVFSFSPMPAVSAFIRSLPKVSKESSKKFVLFSTSVGLPGTTIKRMQSLLSMKGAKVIDSESFSSIFEFDERKMKEVDKFFERFIKKI
jgi:flavorubredoxin